MFDYLTIVSIDGRPGDLHETQLALRHSATQLPGARCLLLSPKRPRQLLSPIEHILIAPMGYLEYSLFVTYALHEFIETNYALLVQNDGWVINADAFSRDFLEFDYIGPPIHIADVIHHGNHTIMERFTWVRREVERAPGVRINYTMNGGFSLRSKKFLKTPALLGMDYRLRPPKMELGGRGTYRLKWNDPEDCYHCMTNRSAMDEAGIRFSSLAAATRFGFEYLNPELHAGLDISQTFGHHGQLRRLVSLDPLILRYLWPEKQVRGIVMEDRIIAAFQKLGYKIEFVS
jgi:hypothetical protein